MRIANIMLRFISQTSRCKVTTVNWNLNKRDPNMEPLTTLRETRFDKQKGAVFGIYIQPEIIPSKKDFQELLPDYQVPLDRSFGTTGIVKAGDFIKLRKGYKI